MGAIKKSRKPGLLAITLVVLVGSVFLKSRSIESNRIKIDQHLPSDPVGEPTEEESIQHVNSESINSQRTGTTIEEKIDQLELSESEKRLVKELGQDSQTKKILKLILIGNHFASLGNTEAAQINYVRELQSTPEETLAALSKILETSALRDPDLAPARASLMNLAAQIPGAENTVHDLALRELTHYIVQEHPRDGSERTEQERMQAAQASLEIDVPVTSHQLLIATASSPEAALEGTVMGIVAQTDQEVRNRLMIQFLDRFPEMEARLRNSLVSKGLQF